MPESKGNSQRSQRSHRSRRSTAGSARRTANRPSSETDRDGAHQVKGDDLSALLEGVATTTEQPICSVALCPICLLVTAVGEARPDLIQHLLVASREVLLAVRSIIDARLEGTSKQSTLERITIE